MSQCSRLCPMMISDNDCNFNHSLCNRPLVVCPLGNMRISYSNLHVIVAILLPNHNWSSLCFLRSGLLPI
ncbi:hypothetical protein L6452_11863 [Arctium lappa]|uniref:Uncharacterized protein n=1 Tax=Arctium lappa TaxID=4217 RepID=A0ACB9DR03_ARCLA|nr:hypothetical protein L6452_11863 [Arctium lappa]